MNEQTRYRITGALFLLAIAIVVLPMVFDGQGVRVTQLPELTEPLPPLPTSAELEALEIPADEVAAHRAEQEVTSQLLDEDGFDGKRGTRLGDPTLLEVPPDAPDEVARTELDAQSVAAAGAAAKRAEAGEPVASQAVAGAPATSTPGSVAAAPVTRTTAAASDDKAPARRAPAVPASKSAGGSKSLAKRPIWAVQLASFASPVNATALRDKLLQDGFEAWTSTARKDAVVRTRVAIGPLLDRRDAERMRDLVSGRYSVSAIVVHMEP